MFDLYCLVTFTSLTFPSNNSGPMSVKLLKVSTQEEGIVVMWHEPDEYKESYQYNLTWQSTDGPISHRLIRENMYTLDNLDRSLKNRNT